VEPVRAGATVHAALPRVDAMALAATQRVDATALAATQREVTSDHAAQPKVQRLTLQQARVAPISTVSEQLMVAART
jgi:hypothetical protein